MQQSSPEALYKNFSETATNSAKDIKAFTALMEDSRSKSILNRAKESRRENVEGLNGWVVTDHHDWLAVKEISSPDTAEEEGKEDEDKEYITSQLNGSEEQDYESLLRKLEGKHPGIEASISKEGSNIMEVRLSKSPCSVPSLTIFVDLSTIACQPAI